MGAPVPEASVDEYRHLPPGVADVRPPGDLPLETVPGVPGLTQGLAYRQLRLGVLAFVGLHALDGVLVQRRTVPVHAIPPGPCVQRKPVSSRILTITDPFIHMF